MTELILLSTAFVAGLVSLKCNLPPLVGFLLAGFALHHFGYESSNTITTLADLGVTLLLFSIGLKLDVRTLLSKEIWGGATLHNLCSTLTYSALFALLKWLGIGALAQMHSLQILLLGFALSFSSTVFAVKSLQEKGEMNATYGTLAIGILVMQDIFAVIFLSASLGKLPHWYAIALFALPLARPLFFKVLDWVGHGEMLVLLGMFLALVAGGGLFSLVGLKADLGALVLGMLLATHAKSSELSKALFNLKELLLVCFFLNIGLSAQISMDGLALALLILLFLPLKGMIYFLVINAFKFRIRTSLLASLALFNYSEFGLIVAGLAYKMHWLPETFMVAIAIVVSCSFIIAAPLNHFGHQIYLRTSPWLKEHASEHLHAKDQLINPKGAQILLLGMGRIGSGAYDELSRRYGNICLGVELREDAALLHAQQGRNVICGDATDPDFWTRILNTGDVKLVLLTMPHHQGNEIALALLKQSGFSGQVAAIAQYNDQLDSLMQQGVDAAFNVYSEAGSGFARHVCEQLTPQFSARK